METINASEIESHVRNGRSMEPIEETVEAAIKSSPMISREKIPLPTQPFTDVTNIGQSQLIHSMATPVDEQEVLYQSQHISTSLTQRLDYLESLIGSSLTLVLQPAPIFQD